MAIHKILRSLGIAMSIGLALLAAHGPVKARPPAIDSPGVVRVAELPPEARQTLALIKQGGPFPYARDGAVFANREHRLARCARYLSGIHGQDARAARSRRAQNHRRGHERVLVQRGPLSQLQADHRMNMDFANLIATGASGVFRCERPLPERALAFAAQQAVHVVPINLAAARDKNAFLNAAAKALAFPEYFGHNWDAFYDCLLELKQRERGTLLVLREASGFARSEPEEFAAASAALQDAADYWKSEGRPFAVIIELELAALAPELPQVNPPGT